MSAGSPNQPEGQSAGTTTSHDAVVADVEAFFQRVAASPVQPRMRRFSGSCQFDVAGAGTWQVMINEGKLTVTKIDGQPAPPAESVISMTAEDFVRVLRREGHMNMLAALLQGRVTVRGDLAFATSVIGSYTAEPIGLPL